MPRLHILKITGAGVALVGQDIDAVAPVQDSMEVKVGQHGDFGGGQVVGAPGTAERDVKRETGRVIDDLDVDPEPLMLAGVMQVMGIRGRSGSACRRCTSACHRRPWPL